MLIKLQKTETRAEEGFMRFHFILATKDCGILCMKEGDFRIFDLALRAASYRFEVDKERNHYEYEVTYG